MTTTTQTREWTEGTPGQCLEELGGHILWVSDDYVGHGTPVLEGDTAEALLADYVAGYHARSLGDECRVWWALYRDGDQYDSGRHTFAAVRA